MRRVFGFIGIALWSATTMSSYAGAAHVPGTYDECAIADTTPPVAPIDLVANGSSPSPWTNDPLFMIDWTNPPDPSGIYKAACRFFAAPTSNYDTTTAIWGTPPSIVALPSELHSHKILADAIHTDETSGLYDGSGREIALSDTDTITFDVDTTGATPTLELMYEPGGFDPPGDWRFTTLPGLVAELQDYIQWHAGHAADVVTFETVLLLTGETTTAIRWTNSVAETNSSFTSTNSVLQNMFTNWNGTAAGNVDSDKWLHSAKGTDDLTDLCNSSGTWLAVVDFDIIDLSGRDDTIAVSTFHLYTWMDDLNTICGWVETDFNISTDDAYIDAEGRLVVEGDPGEALEVKMTETGNAVFNTTLGFLGRIGMDGSFPLYVWLADNVGNIDNNNYSMVDLRYDGTPPIGCIASSPDTSDTSSFIVYWSTGTDVTSGLNGRWDVKVDSGTGWHYWLQDTAATFATYTGTCGHTYYFEAGARDNAGNVELFTEIAECSTVVTGVGVEQNERLPQGFTLFSPVPNPSVGNTVIRYGLPKKAAITLSLYDISGRMVNAIYSGTQKEGYYKVGLNGLAKGTYFIKFEANDFKAAKKLVILR